MRQPFRQRDGTRRRLKTLQFQSGAKYMVDSQPIHETTTQARAGTGPGVMRYVLAVSLLLVVLGLALVVALGWMS
jgi:hypothetical protein